MLGDGDYRETRNDQRPRDAETSGARHRRVQLQCRDDLTLSLFTLARAIAILADPVRDQSYKATAMGPDIVDHLNHCLLGRIADTTFDAKERILARLAVHWPEVSLADLDYTHLQEHLVENVPPGSWRTHRVHINVFVDWGILFDRRSAKNPVKLLPPLRPGPRRTIKTFDEADLDALVAAARFMDDPVRDAARAILAQDSGCRKAELRMLTHRKIDPARRLVTVIGKGDIERDIPIYGEFWDAYERSLFEPIPRLGRLPKPEDFFWFPMRVAGAYKGRARQVTMAYPERPMSQRGMHEWWVRLSRHAGMTKGHGYKKLHTTRHTYATDALDATDGDVYGVQQLLGHKSIRTTETYLHGAKKRKESAARKLADARQAVER